MRQLFFDLQNELDGNASDRLISNYILSAGVTLSIANSYLANIGANKFIASLMN